MEAYNLFDEVKPSDVDRDLLLTIVNGGEVEINPKNKKHDEKAFQSVVGRRTGGLRLLCASRGNRGVSGIERCRFSGFRRIRV